MPSEQTYVRGCWKLNSVITENRLWVYALTKYMQSSQLLKTDMQIFKSETAYASKMGMK